MAHELTHVTQRHIARMFGEEEEHAALDCGHGARRLAASKSPDAANAMIVGGQAAAIQNQLGFSRSMEREADRIGYSLLAPAGFAPQVKDLPKAANTSCLNDNGSWPYLRCRQLHLRTADIKRALRPPPPARATTEHGDGGCAGTRRLDRRGPASQLPKRRGLPSSTPMTCAQLYVATLSQMGDQKPGRCARKVWNELSAHVQAQGDAAAKQQVRGPGAELELAGPAASCAAVARHRRFAGSAATAHAGAGEPRVILPQAKPAKSLTACSRGWWTSPTMPRHGACWHRRGRHRTRACAPCARRSRSRCGALRRCSAIDRFKAAQDLARRGQVTGIQVENAS